MTIDVVVTGGFPGTGEPGPIAFPDPKKAAVVIDRICVPRLSELIQLKLAARRYYDFGDVVMLIRKHSLNESFLDQLAPSVRGDFIECLDEMRREDAYERRQQ